MEFIDQNGCVVFAVQRQQDPNDGNNGLMSQSAGDGSFQLVSDGDEVTLINCYYNVGGVLKRADNRQVTELVETGGILAFDCISEEAMIFEDLEKLNEEQRNLDNYIVALYV